MYENTWRYENKLPWQILKGNTHDLSITLFLQDFNQMGIQNPAEILKAVKS